MAQNTSDQSEPMASDDIVPATVDEDAALDEDYLQQLGIKPLEELFNAVVDRVGKMVLDAANSLKDHRETPMKNKPRVKQYLQMNRVLLGLQHWANDIQVNKKSPLSITKKDNDRFNSLVLILRRQILAIMSACSVVDKASEEARQGEIDHLDQLSRQLRNFVAPLRIFVEDELGLGLGQMVREVASDLDPDRFGKPGKRTNWEEYPTLREAIDRSLIKSEFDTGAGRYFVPNRSIRDLVLPGSVRFILANELPSGHEEIDQDLVDYIVFRARKLFAIRLRQDLARGSVLKAMVLFKQNKMSDADLPLDSEQTKLSPPVFQLIDDSDDEDGWGKSPQMSPGVKNTAILSSPTRRFDSKLHDIDPNEEIWGDLTRRFFIEEYQWVFLAPIFSTKDETQDLKQSSVLPFTLRDRETEGGGFGIVSRIQIQEGHIEDPENLFGSKMPSSYALKEIRLDRSDYKKIVNNWKKELANLRSVTRLKHAAILRFVTGFRREEGQVLDHYLISEWADGGNLRNFWTTHKSPEATPGLVKEVVTQLLGLADAICTIHYSSKFEAGIVHGDLKPENILRFKPEGNGPGLLGTLKIGDWGLSKEKGLKTAQENKASLYRASIKYEPPEMSKGVPVVGRNTFLKTRCRLYDVWSFGCIMLEFIVWLAEGTPGLADLDSLIDHNQFWEKPTHPLGFDTQPQVRNSVCRKMDKLDNYAACREPALRSLLHFVRNRALVVHLPTHLAALEPEDLRGLESSDLARFESAGGKVPGPATGPGDGLKLSQAQTIAWINSINSYDSKNPHAEAAEIVEAKEPPQSTRPIIKSLIANTTGQPAPEGEFKKKLTGPASAPAPAASLQVTEPQEPPRAKATELLKTMRQIMILAADEATKLPPSETSAGETT